MRACQQAARRAEIERQSIKPEKTARIVRTVTIKPKKKATPRR